MKQPNSRSQRVTIEMLQQDEIETPRPRTNAEALDLLVQQRIAEMLAARDEFAFEPFFRTRQVAYELKRLQTVPERKKWAVFFERHGCLSCHGREHSHESNGLCRVCHRRVFKQLKRIVSELMNECPGNDKTSNR